MGEPTSVQEIEARIRFKLAEIRFLQSQVARFSEYSEGDIVKYVDPEKYGREDTPYLITKIAAAVDPPGGIVYSALSTEGEILIFSCLVVKPFVICNKTSTGWHIVKHEGEKWCGKKNVLAKFSSYDEARVFMDQLFESNQQ